MTGGEKRGREIHKRIWTERKDCVWHRNRDNIYYIYYLLIYKEREKKKKKEQTLVDNRTDVYITEGSVPLSVVVHRPTENAISAIMVKRNNI